MGKFRVHQPWKDLFFTQTFKNTFRWRFWETQSFVVYVYIYTSPSYDIQLLGMQCCFTGQSLIYRLCFLVVSGKAGQTLQWITEWRTLWNVVRNCYSQNLHVHRFRALSSDSENEIAMRKLFAKARSQTRHLLKEQLADFRQKRTVGLGNLYGPSDAELGLCLDNRDELYKNRSTGKTYSQWDKRSSGSYILLKIVNWESIFREDLISYNCLQEQGAQVHRRVPRPPPRQPQVRETHSVVAHGGPDLGRYQYM